MKATLRQEDLTEEDIEAMMYYDIAFFRACCPRVVLPPSRLYWRVRAVFATFGNKIDSATNKPLFNDRAWKKANNVLKEIALGFASDPPGVSLYVARQKPNGEAETNKYGLPTYDCLRGTNLTEAHHQQMLQSIGTSSTGIEMSDCVRGEYRQRYNQRVSERRRAGFPKFGHYDTWLIDQIQISVEKNHNVLIYPTWRNTSDYEDTPETFGTVPLQSPELTSKINGLNIAPSLTCEQKYLAKQQGVSVPFTPVASSAEKKLFARLSVEEPMLSNDMTAMAERWIDFVDGKNIFPKLEVYLRTHREPYVRNKRIEHAVKEMEDETNMLKQLNSNTLTARDEPQFLNTEQEEEAFDSNEGGDLPFLGEDPLDEGGDLPFLGEDPLDESDNHAETDNGKKRSSKIKECNAASEPTNSRAPFRHWPTPLQPLPLPPATLTQPRITQVIGGVQVGLSVP